jgi:SAM-dependent methyltransferase
MPWTNTVAFITGAGSGIGRALSLELARRGAQVVGADIDGEAAERVAAAAGAGARAIEGAASGGRLDLLVNNAGIGVSGEVHEIPLAHWERILDINVRGVVHGVAAGYLIMVRQGHVLCPSAIDTPLLDSTPPADLPAVPWGPDTRRLLEAFAGPPYGVEALAREAIDAVERNEGVIVRPSRAGFLWRLRRWFPALVERGGLAAVERERRPRR